MADAIRFKEFFCCNMQQNRCIEENSKALFSYAGIHDHSFDDKLNDAFTSLDASVWNTGDASGTWTIDSGQLKGVGSGWADWHWLLSVDDMPSEATLSVYSGVACERGGIIFRATDNDNLYLFYWDDHNSVSGFKKKSGGSWSTLIELPKGYCVDCTIKVQWREIKFRPTADEKWLFMSAWIGDEFVATAVDDISSSTPGKKVGFSVYESDTVRFDNVRIPELTEITDWCSLDTGESPGSALMRMMGRRHVKYYLRYDATLRMWRPKASASAYTYQRHITNFRWDVDSRNLSGHYRQVGAWEQADYFDTTLLQRGIRRFHKDNNPDLLTKESCYDEAEYAIQGLKEDSDRIDMTVPAQVLQEPEDVVTVLFERDGNTVINSLDYIIDLGQGYTVGYQGKKLKSTLHLRKEQ